MNKKYIDFVPTKEAKTKSNARKDVAIASKRSEGAKLKTASTRNVKRSTASVRPIAVQKQKPAEIHEAEFGIIEELGPVKSSEQSVEKSTKITGKAFMVPKTTFINQEKVVKRPLSKNVYQKKIVTPKEEPKGPVTIITKPEKDAHVNLVVAIILTIILGAAAGTVAFLLLPK